MKEMIVKENVVEQCIKGKDLTTPTKTQCEKIDSDSNTCIVYMKPFAQWRNVRSCPMATHYHVDENKVVEKIRVGQQKQKKKK
jgi:hypothetical protein